MSKRSLSRTGVLVVLALSALIAVVFSAAASGVTSAKGADRFTQVGTGEVQASYYTPLGISKAPAVVMVQLSGKTVAEAQGEAGRTLTEAEQKQIVDQLSAQQDALKGQIQALGGTILNDFQYAYNGIKVSIGRDKVSDLQKLTGVVGVHAVARVERSNVNSAPLLNVPAVWGGSPAFHGTGVKIAVIDTGIDYTHANFGGPGTVAAFNAAAATSTLPANPTLFGPNAVTKVKGGYDLVGDDYNADPDSPTYQPIPHPDPNPLDCAGHGSHVAGTAAGYGVLSDGSTYGGPWNASTISSHTWNIGPGMAPQANLYALRVFGCGGSTDVTVDAIEWAVANHMDIINMSLGSAFGSADDPSAVASTNAVKAGVTVVASSGNAGAAQYITGAPAAGTGAISVAANDAIQSTPAATMALSTGPTITAQNSNGFALSPTSYNVVAINDNPATPLVNEALGCSVADYGSLPPNALAVVYRGNCARVAKAIFGQQAGAAAVAMVNNATGYPPFEGKITSNPDDGTPFVVTIPFFGVRGSSTFPVPASTDGGKLYAASGGTAAVSPTTLPNANYKGFADFTSAGPRTGDSWLKPDVTAPGVSVTSTLVGSGNEGTIMSGTSMASPAVAGIAALVKQAHPKWDSREIKDAIVNTGEPSGVTNYRTSRGGTGLANALSAVQTQVLATGDARTGSLSFGFSELASDFSGKKSIEIRNWGTSAVTLAVSQTNIAGSPHSVSFSAPSVTVAGGAKATLDVTLNVPVATVGNSSAFREVAGLVTLTPGAGQNNGVALRVPYYLVPRALSNVTTKVNVRTLKANSPSTTANVKNGGPIAGDADFYAWGLQDGKDEGHVSNDMRAVGVQSFEWDPTQQLLVFAVNVWDRWSNAASNEFDIAVDVDNDGTVDYFVVGVDIGAVTTGDFNGQMGSFVFSTRSPGASLLFRATAPTDSATLLLPALTSQLCRPSEPCLSSANPRITYAAAGFDLIAGGADVMPGEAKYNAWSSSISQGDFATLPPNGSAAVPISINPTEWALTPALGIMVVTLDDRSTQGNEADLVEMFLK